MKNNSKNILLISYFFSPQDIVGAKRYSYLSYYLSKEGIMPHILTIKEKYIHNRDDSLISNGIIHRTSVVPYYPIKWKKLNIIYRAFFNFLDPYIGWILPAVLKGILLVKKYNIKTLIATGLPFSSYLVPYLISFFYNVRVIIDYRDPWVLYNEKYSFFKKRINWFIEKRILKRADGIIFNTKKTKLQYCKLKLNFDIERKSFVIPNGYIDLPNIEAKVLERNKKVIVYAGNFYGKRSLNYLLKAIERVNQEKLLGSNSVAIHIFGSIPLKEKEKLKLYNISSDSIVEHERVSYYELLQYLKGADILYLAQGKDHEYSIPYKLIDYLSVNKPILATTSKNSATRDIIEETNSGEVGYVDELESTYTALKNILLNPNKYTFIGAEKYSFNIVARQYINLLINYL